MKLDTNETIVILNRLVDYVTANKCYESAGIDVESLTELSKKIENDEGLLDDFKAYYSMDVISKLRGKNKLSYLDAYRKTLNNEESK